MNYSCSQQEEDFVLPEEWKEIMKKIGSDIDRKIAFYNIDFKEIKPLYIIEELNRNNFGEEFKMHMLGNNFIAIDTLGNVIKFLYDLFPSKNLIIPEADKNRLIKVVNIYTGKSKMEVLDEVLNQLNLKMKKFCKNENVLYIDFCSFVPSESDIPPVNTKFDLLNTAENEFFLYLKDLESSNLNYFYSKLTDKKLIIEKSDSCSKINFISINKKNWNNLDFEIVSKFKISSYKEVEQDWIEIYRE